MISIKITDEKLTKEWALIQYIRDLTNDIKNKVTKLISSEPVLKVTNTIFKNSILENKSKKKLSIELVEYSLLHSIIQAKGLLKKNLQEIKNQANLNNYIDKEDIEKKSLLILLWSKRFIAYGFSKEQIMQLATSDNGSENFQLIDINHDKFFALKYSADSLAKVCSFSNGHNLLIYILNNGEILNKLYDNHDQIIESWRSREQSVISKVDQILTYNHSLQVKIYEDSSATPRLMLVKYQQLKQQQSGFKLDGNIIDNKINVVNYTKLAFLDQHKM